MLFTPLAAPPGMCHMRVLDGETAGKVRVVFSRGGGSLARLVGQSASCARCIVRVISGTLVRVSALIFASTYEGSVWFCARVYAASRGNLRAWLLGASSQRVGAF